MNKHHWLQLFADDGGEAPAQAPEEAPAQRQKPAPPPGTGSRWRKFMNG